MVDNLSDFTDEQWDFLSLLDIFKGPVGIDVLGELAPLPPGPLFELINRGKALGILCQKSDSEFSLADSAPKPVRQKLKTINNPQRVAYLYSQCQALKLLEKMGSDNLMRLMNKTGRGHEAAMIVHEEAQAMISEGNLQGAARKLTESIDYLERLVDDQQAARLFINATLELSQLGFRFGGDPGEINRLLNRSRQVAETLGDQRSLALIGLHFGRYYFLDDKLSRSLEGMKRSLGMVEDIGDADIMTRTAEFFGLYYYIQGQHSKAVDYFVQVMESSEHSADYFAKHPVQFYYGYGCLVLGQFHRAIGFLNAIWQRALQQNEPMISAQARALLSAALTMIGRDEEASMHLADATRAAKELNSPFVTGFILLFTSMHYFLTGEISSSYGAFAEFIQLTAEAKIRIHQYPTPVVLEMLSEFNRLGFREFPGLGFDSETERLIEGPNIHLRGVALRIKAKKTFQESGDLAAAVSMLQSSLECLILSGDPAELAKTRVEMARLNLRQGNKQEATSIALKAWEGLSGLRKSEYPDDLKHLLVNEAGQGQENVSASANGLEQSLTMLRRMLQNPDSERLLGMMIETINEYLGAERGALFAEQPDKHRKLSLLSGRNLNDYEVHTEGFKERLSLIFQALRSRKPDVVLSDGRSDNRIRLTAGWLVCIPIELENGCRSVLYAESSYLKNRIDMRDSEFLSRISAYVAEYASIVDRAGNQGAIGALATNGEASNRNGNRDQTIVTRHPEFLRILNTADKVAQSDSTVLITGETGVGKELVARRIHDNSARRAGPFVVVDLSTVPESLIESELFGHEKGSFTGADQQKKGQFELANQGTLFIDELGEIPLSVQVKLLRAIQEKTFSRIGGLKTIHSDFRLLAATNRNLETEVSEGRFREDLYYRLNVLPLTIPPLRSRKTDIPILARHFFSYFTKTLHRPGLSLSNENESALTKYPWPGNVRELRNVIERTVLLSENSEVQVSLPRSQSPDDSALLSGQPTLDELQRRFITHVLEQANGRIGGAGGAAQRLGMKRTSLYARMKQLGMR